MKNFESLAVKIALGALSVIAAGYVMNLFADVQVVKDAKKGFTG